MAQINWTYVGGGCIAFLICLSVIVVIIGACTHWFGLTAATATTTPAATTSPASTDTPAPAITAAAINTPAVVTTAPSPVPIPTVQAQTLQTAPIVSLPTVITAPGACNAAACQSVIASYLAKNWAYTSSSFGECAGCPVVSYPNSLQPTLSNQPLRWAVDGAGYTRRLDCDGGGCSNPANRVQIWQPTNAGGQLWTWRNGGLYSGGELLATLANGTANNTPVIATTDSGAGGTGGQEWRWQPKGDGWQLRNPASGRCLDITGGRDVNGTQAVLWDCPTSSTRWSPG